MMTVRNWTTTFTLARINYSQDIWENWERYSGHVHKLGALELSPLKTSKG